MSLGLLLLLLRELCTLSRRLLSDFVFSCLCSGYTYAGSFVQGLLVGDGTVTNARGDVTTGTFFPDATSQGTVVYQNGDRYTGSLVHNKRNGFGVHEFKKLGARYEGQWEHDLSHGLGSLTWCDSGDFIQGVWKEGSCAIAQGQRTMLMRSLFFVTSPQTGEDERGEGGGEREGCEGGELAKARYTGQISVFPQQGAGDASGHKLVRLGGGTGVERGGWGSVNARGRGGGGGWGQRCGECSSCQS